MDAPVADARAGRASPAGIPTIAALAGELLGALRQPAVLEVFTRHVQAALAPDLLLVALPGAGGALQPVAALPSAPALTPVLDTLADQPALLPAEVAARLGPLARSPGLPPALLSAPLPTAAGHPGLVLLGGAEGRWDAADLALLQALAAQCAVALDAARVLDEQVTGRRSWEEAVDAIALALCIVDDAGAVRRANRAFADLIGVPVVSLAGQSWDALVPPRWRALLGAAAAGLGREVEWRDGNRTFAVTAFRIAAANRPATVLVFDDQTERRRLQDQLIQSEKMSAIGQLIAGIAHDLNNPLASVVGFADFLLEAPDVPAAIREPLRVVQEEAERAAAIVRNLLGFARKQERQRRPTPILGLLERIVLLLRSELQAARIDVAVEAEPDLPAPVVDANQLQQVFVNLLTNAAQAIASTGRGGRITLRARRWRDGVAVDVADDGPGMPEALAAQVFEPFFTTKPEGEGTGLGLSISQGIVKEHGGRISLQTAPGRGATFTVELPLTAPAARHTPPPAPPPPARRSRILVIDDEPHILHYMRATLESWGHVVDVASDGLAGVERAATGAYDLVITDLRMPGLHGRDVFAELERRNPAAAGRVIFSTGDTVRGDTLAFLEGLGRPYLHKPFSLTELRTVVDQMARGRRDSLPPTG